MSFAPLHVIAVCKHPTCVHVRIVRSLNCSDAHSAVLHLLSMVILCTRLFLQYTIPHLGYINQHIYGGLGMVVDTFIR